MTRTVHIVDDDTAVLKGLHLLMSSVELQTKAYHSAREFLQSYDQGGCARSDCLIADVRMPDMSGLELQEALIDRQSELPLILISGHGDISMAVKAMQAGAQSFIEKPVPEQHLIDEVFKALRPKRRPGDGRIAILASYREQLTERQREVFDLLVQGLRTKAVASRLGISPRTVEVHRSGILERLGAQSFSQLMTSTFEAELLGGLNRDDGEEAEA
ncbi:MAG: response regulator transcription factor [Hyphomicrobiaceae bacterium]